LSKKAVSSRPVPSLVKVVSMMEALYKNILKIPLEGEGRLLIWI